MKTPNYRKSTTTFKYTNPHPKGIRTVGDCVIRAISIATGKDWLTVYDELVVLGRELLAPPTDMKVVTAYLDPIATRKDVKVDGKRLTARDVTKLRGTFVIRTAGHVATVKNGKLRDTWDSGAKSAYIIWKL